MKIAVRILTAEVITMTEMETHYVILARVQDAKVTSDYNPMTYKYYHRSNQR